MEEVVQTLKEKFANTKEFKDIPITTPNYLWEKSLVNSAKVAFAIGYMLDNEKVNKEQALQIIIDIMQGKI